MKNSEFNLKRRLCRFRSGARGAGGGLNPTRSAGRGSTGCFLNFGGASRNFLSWLAGINNMNINIKATQVDLTPALKEYVEEKFGSLAKFLKRWEAESPVEVWVEVARTTRHHHKGEVFRAEGDVKVPGYIFRATEEDSDIRSAVDRVRDKLQAEIVKYKEMHTDSKRGVSTDPGQK